MDAGPAAEPHRRADAERNAQRIVQAAAQLLAEDPQAGMAAIAEAAGVTRITVNRHFRTRENLVVAVYERMLARAAEVLRECRLEEGTATDALTRLVHGWLGAGPLIAPARILEQGEAALPPEVRARYHEGEIGPPLLALMERGRAAGEFSPDLPAEWMARLLGGGCRAALEAIEAGTLAPADAPGVVVRSLLRGLRG